MEYSLTSYDIMSILVGLAFIGLMTVVVGLLIWWLIKTGNQETQLILDEGIITHGTIKDIRHHGKSRSSRRANTWFYVSYTDETGTEREAAVFGYKGAEIGDIISIKYTPPIYNKAILVTSDMTNKTTIVERYNYDE